MSERRLLDANLADDAAAAAGHRSKSVIPGAAEHAEVSVIGDNFHPILLTSANETKLWFRSARVHSAAK